MNGFSKVQHDKEKAAADAATDRLKKGLCAAKSVVRDYRAKLRSKNAVEPAADRKRLFQFDR